MKKYILKIRYFIITTKLSIIMIITKLYEKLYDIVYTLIFVIFTKLLRKRSLKYNRQYKSTYKTFTKRLQKRFVQNTIWKAIDILYSIKHIINHYINRKTCTKIIALLKRILNVSQTSQRPKIYVKKGSLQFNEITAQKRCITFRIKASCKVRN